MKIRVIDFGYSKLPNRAHYNDAGADVFSTEDVVIPAHSSVAVKTGMGIMVPDGYMVCVYPKSGMASKGIISNVPPIDSGYRGEIHAIISNITDEPFHITEGMKVGQLVLTPVILADYIPAELLDAEDSRGTGGFGSTGA